MLHQIRQFISELIEKSMNKRARRRLKNDNFSILCSNCIGGTIYHRLGKEFLTPTINLWLTQGDFIKFAVDVKHYVSLPLEFIKKEDINYPVAKLDDITIHFNHAKTEEEAAENWNRRKERINYDNLYLILYYRDNYTIEDIRRIEQANCRGKVVLTNKKIPLEYAYYIKENVGKPYSDSFLDKDWFGIRSFEKKWDYIKWLNQGIQE